MVVRKISLGWIISSDAAKSKNFFTETLGMNLASSAPEYGWYELVGSQEEGARLGIGQQCPTMPSDVAGQNTVLTFEVDDIVAAMAELLAKDVKFLSDIIEVPGHVKMATFVDPDNNKFQLVQMIDENK